jgi:hypothetical protein
MPMAATATAMAAVRAVCRAITGSIFSKPRSVKGPKAISRFSSSATFSLVES